MEKAAKHIPARYVALLVQHLEEGGMDCTSLLEAAGIGRASLRHSQAQLPPRQVVDLTRSLVQASGRGDLGLAIGSLLGAGQLGELGRAMLSCATAREALDCCARNYELVTPSFSMQVRDAGDRCEVLWLPISAVPYDVVVLAYDIALAAFHSLLLPVLGKRMPGYDVYFSMLQPAHAVHYRALKGVRCHFGVEGLPSLRILIPAEPLGVPMPLAHAADLEACEARLRAMLANTPRQRDWKAWVQLMLGEAHEHQPTQEELAALSGISASTLSRYLAAQGCSFREIAGEIRHEQACRLLAEGGSAVSDVARRLGYGHAENFTRAFKARAGMSPAQFVRQGASRTQEV